MSPAELPPWFGLISPSLHLTWLPCELFVQGCESQPPLTPTGPQGLLSLDRLGEPVPAHPLSAGRVVANPLWAWAGSGKVGCSFLQVPDVPDSD